MPVSRLDPGALARLTSADLASLALSADQERRRAEAAGRNADSFAHDVEASRLARLSLERAKRDAY